MLSGIAGVLALLPALAGAEGEDTQDVSAAVEKVGKVAHDLGFVIMPIPRSDPTLGSGLQVPALFLYSPDGKGRPWMTGAGALYTDSHSWGAGVFQKAYLLDDRVRLAGAAGYADLNLDFYGIGANAGKQNVAVPLEQRGSFVFLEGLSQVGHAFFLGAQYRRVALESSFAGGFIPGAGLNIPPAQLDYTSSAIGPVVQYDTRDNELNPSRGTYVNASWVFARDAIGSDGDYEKALVRINRYLSVMPGRVVALRASLCSAGGQAPFFDLCLFGANNDLRGYVGGQYRDKAMYAVQGEYRWQLTERWGIVGFGGVGSVARTWRSFSANNLLPSVGAGLRFLASKKYRVNVSVDYAQSRDGGAAYFYIGEAF